MVLSDGRFRIHNCIGVQQNSQLYGWKNDHKKCQEFFSCLFPKEPGWGSTPTIDSWFSDESSATSANEKLYTKMKHLLDDSKHFK